MPDSQVLDNYGRPKAQELPSTWEQVKLGELLHLAQYGLSVRGESSGRYPILRMNCQDSGRVVLRDLQYVELLDRELEQYRLRDRDLLFNRTNSFELVGRTAIYRGNQDLVFASYLLRLSVDETKVLPEYLNFFLNSPECQATLKTYATRGVSQANISASKLRQLPVTVPSRPEQEAIAHILAKIQNRIDSQRRRSDLLNQLKSAGMAKLFREGLCGEPLKQTEIGEIPRSWEVKTCEDICDPITVGIVVTPAKYYVPTGVPCFRSFNIKPNRLTTNALVFISPESNELHSKSKLRAGDVLVVRTGYPGTACVVPPEYDGANCIDLLIARPRTGLINAEFLAAYLNSPEGKGQVAQQQGGLAQQHYNVGALRRLRVPVPSPEDQIAISEILGAIERRLIVSEQKSGALQRLFTTSLHSLMTGAIRVKDLDLPEVNHA